MSLRIASASVGAPILILLVWAGSLWFLALVAAVVAVGTIEMSNIESARGRRPAMLYAVLGSITLVVVAHLLGDPSSTESYFVLAVSVAAGVSLIWLLWNTNTGRYSATFGSTLATTFYVGGLLFHGPLLRAVDDGFEWVLFLLAATFATDTLALVVGKTVGRHQLAPHLSPSKTWEGAIGGVIGATSASVAVGYALSLNKEWPELLVLGVLIGVVGQLGDLAESRFKRLAGVRNSGWIVPGHGGTLDRLDSIVFNLVVVYYFVS